MEYSVTNMFAEKIDENVYVKAFVQGSETEQREMPPLVSVLMASYNHEKYVEASVRSVMAQKAMTALGMTQEQIEEIALRCRG